MKHDPLSLPEIRRAGLKALLDSLGVAGTIRFLQQFDPGYGNYTLDRHEWLEKLTVDEIVHEIESRENA